MTCVTGDPLAERVAAGAVRAGVDRYECRDRGASVCVLVDYRVDRERIDALAGALGELGLAVRAVDREDRVIRLAADVDGGALA